VDAAASEPSGWSKARIEALSDGVFAIAMTLLVLEIKVPDLDRHVDAATLWHEVRARWPLFFSFFITFMLTSLFWFWHHVSFHSIRRVDGVIVWINLLFLMFVSLAPFSTAMLGSFTLRQPVSLAFYFGNQLALGLTLNAYWIYAKRQGLLAYPEVPIVRRFSTAIRVQPIACLATLARIPIDPQWCFNVYAIVQIPMVVYMRRRRRAEKHA
jgi:uncharacterized membrane protein